MPRFGKGDLLRLAHDGAPDGKPLPGRRRPHRLRLQLERGAGAVLARQARVHGEIHGGVEHDGMDAGLDDPVRIAGERLRFPGGARPPGPVVVLDPVVLERDADRREYWHPTVT